MFHVKRLTAFIRPSENILAWLMTYKTITTPTQAEFKDKGSRFIAYAYPIRTMWRSISNSLKRYHRTRHDIGVTPIDCVDNAVSRKRWWRTVRERWPPHFGADWFCRRNGCVGCGCAILAVRYCVPGLIHTIRNQRLRRWRWLLKRMSKDSLVEVRISCFEWGYTDCQTISGRYCGTDLQLIVSWQWK